MFAVLEQGGTIVFQNEDFDVCEDKCNAYNEHMRPDYKYYSVVELVVKVPEPRGEIPAVSLEPYYVLKDTQQQVFHMPHPKQVRIGDRNYSMVRTEKEDPILVALPTVISAQQVFVDRLGTTDIGGLIRVQGDLFRIEKPHRPWYSDVPTLVPAGS